jgi:hypothetical protein
MARDVIDHLIWEMGQAFDALFATLRNLRDDDWLWLPDGGARSVSAVVGHVASSKVMFHNHAFGDGSLSWEDPAFHLAHPPTEGAGFDPVRLVEWLRSAEFEVRRNVDALADDDELLRDRGVPWGRTMPTRWIINRLIHHDSFHAGEINHLRSVHQRDDVWEWEREGERD